MTQFTVAGHTIPDWAKCYCVSRHFPRYTHVLPYQMPEGDIIYLCPNSHHSLTVFLRLCEELGGTPNFNLALPFGQVVQRLGSLIWAVQQGELTREQYMRMETYRRLGRRLDNDR